MAMMYVFLSFFPSSSHICLSHVAELSLIWYSMANFLEDNCLRGCMTIDKYIAVEYVSGDYYYMTSFVRCNQIGEKSLDIQ